MTGSTFETYNELCNRLDSSDKVYYSRFGDGDIFILQGRSEMLHSVSPELQKEMWEAFKISDCNYLRGIAVDCPNEPGMVEGLFKRFSYNDDMRKWLEKNYTNYDPKDFWSYIMFHYFSCFHQEVFVKFLNKYVRPKKKMFIGSVDKDSMENLFGKIDYYVKVPPKNAYYSISDWWPIVEKNIDDVEVCLPNCGMASRIINKRLWLLNKKVHSLDIGSIVDAVAGIPTRTWIRMLSSQGVDIKNILIDKK